MKYKYKINNLKLFGNHGVYETEKNEGQNFYFDVEFICEYKTLSDQVDCVVDYSSVCDDIKYVFNKNRYNLLESLLSDIIFFLTEKYKTKFSITVKKESEYMQTNLDTVSVEWI